MNRISVLFPEGAGIGVRVVHRGRFSYAVEKHHHVYGCRLTFGGAMRLARRVSAKDQLQAEGRLIQ